MKHYEGMFLVPSVTANTEWDETVEKVEALISKYDGESSMTTRWDERALKYDIGKHRRAGYLLSYFRMPAEKLEEFRRELNYSEIVIRHLLLARSETDFQQGIQAQTEKAERAAEAAKEMEVRETEARETEARETEAREAAAKEAEAKEAEAKEAEAKETEEVASSTDKASSAAESSEASEASEAEATDSSSEEEAAVAKEGGDAEATGAEEEAPKAEPTAGTENTEEETAEEETSTAGAG